MVAHPSSILSIHLYVNGVLSLSPSSLRFHSRGGLLRSSLTLPSLGSFRCSSVPDPSASLVLLSAAGAEADAASHAAVTHPTATARGRGLGSSHLVPPTPPLSAPSSPASSPTLSKPSLLLFDISANTALRQVQLLAPLTCLHSLPYSLHACGRADGSVELRDPRSLRAEATLSAHTGPILSLSSTPHLLITAGLPSSTAAASDPLLRVFDLRRIEPLAPLVYRGGRGARFLRFLAAPGVEEGGVVVVGREGRVAFGDAGTGLLGGMRLECSMMGMGVEATAMDLSSSRASLVIGDSGGLLHQWGVQQMAEEGDSLLPPTINPYSASVDYVSPPAPPQATMSLASSLGDLPFPYLCTLGYGPLLSDLSAHTLLTSMRPLPPVDERRFTRLRWLDHVGYANAGQQGEDDLSATPLATHPNDLSTLRHFSAKGRNAGTRATQTSSPAHPQYTRVMLAVPKYGVHTMDFTQYNRTPFTALDCLLPNSYVNPLLLQLYFIPALHRFMLEHLCTQENCLRCEIGFLFHMMDGARGGIAQPRNLLRSLRLIPEAAGLGLLDEMDWREEEGRGRDEGRWVLHRHWVKEEPKEVGEAKIALRIQDSFRFLLEQLRKEGAKDSHHRQKEREEERLQRGAYHQQQLHRKQRAVSWQLTQLHQLVQRQGRATREQEDAMRGMTEEMHQLSALAASHAQQPTERAVGVRGEDESKARVIMDDVFGHAVVIERQCVQGQHTLQRQQTVLSSRMTYSTQVYTASSPLPSTQHVGLGQTGEAMLQRALVDESVGRVWCEHCGAYQVMRSRRQWLTFPHTLNVECNIASDRDERVWRQARPAPTEEDRADGDVHWLPAFLAVTLDTQGRGAQVQRLSRAQAEAEAAAGGREDRRVYELTGVISRITDPPEKDSPLFTTNGEHLVTHCNISRHYHKEASAGTADSPRQWYAFNEFAILPSDTYEATCFTYPWKQPCVLLYSAMEAAGVDVPPAVNPFMAGVVPFSYAPSLSLRSDLHRPTFTPLHPTERLSPAMRVAIDCEFVCVQPELLSHTGSVLRPARLTLARVSVIRGTAGAPLLGVPFMDDYINTSEPVVDYLTQYSGLSPGDLDAATSPHYLTTLKQSYIRLRHLVDAGVCFIGHGLVNDFAMLNLWVRGEQVVDTVELWRVEGQRRLSLRFLAKHVLGVDIQREVHDSIEDARTALHLVAKWEELKQRGKLDETLRQLYTIGRREGFKV